MKAVILSAGRGVQLFPLTKDTPKTLLKINGDSIIEKLVNQLLDNGVRDFIIVVGFGKKQVIDTLKNRFKHSVANFTFVENDIYFKTNTMYSLWLTKQYTEDDEMLLIDGDIVCEDIFFESILEKNAEENMIIVDKNVHTSDEEVKVNIGINGNIRKIGKTIEHAHGEFCGISKFSKKFVASMFYEIEQFISKDLINEFYEEAIDKLCDRYKIHSLLFPHGKWVEIDFLTDYYEAQKIFGVVNEEIRQLISKEIKKQYLLCPGPVMVPMEVKKALCHTDIGHREEEFSQILTRVRQKLSKIFGVKNFHKYTTITITGSGTAANECFISSYAIHKYCLFLSNGEFGERLVKVAKIHGVEHNHLRFNWADTFKLDEIEEELKNNKYDLVVMVHHETSTGRINPLKEVAAICNKYGTHIYADCVSSLGAEEVNIEDNNITFCSSSANKALASVSGLSFICGLKDQFEYLSDKPANTAYLNMYNHYYYQTDLLQTPNTPAVSLFFALEAALDIILEHGLAHHINKTKMLANRLRDGMKELGFKFLLPENEMSNVLTTVFIPRQFVNKNFHNILKNEGYITYDGKGELENRIFQVANMGNLVNEEIDEFLKVLAKVVREY